MLIMLDGLELTKLGRQLLIFLRLPGLAAQIRELIADLADHVPQAFEIGFRGLQPQFGLVAAAVKPRDTGGVFKDAAALLRLGVDELADLALLHERLAPRAGGGVGEKDLNVFRTSLFAVDLVDRSPPRAECAAKFPAHRHR